VESRPVGFAIMLAGLAIVAIGAAVAFGLLNWFGRLPGDIRIESGNARVYVPITSMLLVSVALTVIASLARRLF
jgi:hypothetical protein